MNKQKPVWRMNTGRGVPSDLQSYLIDKSGIKYFAYGEFRDDDNLWTLETEFCGSDVAAYKTTRTKAAKYGRMECGCKDGVFYMPSIEGGYYEPHPCDKCNGKGYRLEAVK